MTILFVAVALVVGALIGLGIGAYSREELEESLWDHRVAISTYKEIIAKLEAECEKRFKQLIDTSSVHNAYCNNLIEECGKTIKGWKRIVELDDEVIRIHKKTIQLNDKSIEKNKETIREQLDLMARLKERVGALEDEIDCEGEEWKLGNKKRHPEDDPDFRV